MRRVARRRREQQGAIPSELDRFRHEGLVVPWLRPHLADAREETLGLVAAQGGIERMSEQRLAATQDHGRLGAILRGLVQMFVEKPDAELATRIATVCAQRRGLLALLGIERREAEVPDLRAYLESRRAAAQSDRATNGAPAGPEGRE